jgi:hypothetical protein
VPAKPPTTTHTNRVRRARSSTPLRARSCETMRLRRSLRRRWLSLFDVSSCCRATHDLADAERRWLTNEGVRGLRVGGRAAAAAGRSDAAIDRTRTRHRRTRAQVELPGRVRLQPSGRRRPRPARPVLRGLRLAFQVRGRRLPPYEDEQRADLYTGRPPETSRVPFGTSTPRYSWPTGCRSKSWPTTWATPILASHCAPTPTSCRRATDAAAIDGVFAPDGDQPDGLRAA